MPGSRATEKPICNRTLYPSPRSRRGTVPLYRHVFHLPSLHGGSHSPAGQTGPVNRNARTNSRECDETVPAVVGELIRLRRGRGEISPGLRPRFTTRRSSARGGQASALSTARRRNATRRRLLRSASGRGTPAAANLIEEGESSSIAKRHRQSRGSVAPEPKHVRPCHSHSSIARPRTAAAEARPLSLAHPFTRMVLLLLWRRPPPLFWFPSECDYDRALR
ncbi:hypothetical protein MRX96_003673 [Rhipicephalus microplus]